MTDLIELSYERAEVNAVLLTEELRRELGDALVGVSTGPHEHVRVYVRAASDDVQRDLPALVAQVVTAHDAKRLTAEQHAERERSTTLKALRDKPWSQWTAEDKDTLLRLLAEQLFSISA